MAIKINDIRELLSKGGGVASSNTYKVTFEENQRSTTGVTNKVLEEAKRVFGGSFDTKDLQGDTVGTATEANYISLMCDEATLPGIQLATGQINGMYTGSGQYNYAHTRLYNDLTLSWICDANMTPLKWLQIWMDSIFVEEGNSLTYRTKIQSNANDVQARDRNRSVRMNYMDEYTMQVSVLKAEKNNSSEVGRPSIRYVMEGAFPYSIDSVPLSFGSSQLVKVSANFYYERWFTYYTNQWGQIR